MLFEFSGVGGRYIHKDGLHRPTPRNSGSSLSTSDRQVLADSLQGNLIVKGETPKEEYDDVIKRWNEVYIKQAISPPHLKFLSHPVALD